MENPPRPDGGPNHRGWALVVAPHRCSVRYCEAPAVIAFWIPVGGYGWQKQQRHWRARYSCAEHMAENYPDMSYDLAAGTIWWTNRDGDREYLAGPIPAA